MDRLSAVILLTLTAGCIDPGPDLRQIADPHQEFKDATGLSLSGAKVVAVGDTHGGFHGDGELYLAFKTDPEVLKKWLAESPPWKQEEWLSGPVPSEISSCCFDAPTEGMDSPSIKYVAQDFELSSIAWHNGRLLVVDAERGYVALCWWDF